MRDDKNFRKKLQRELQGETDQILQIIEADPILNVVIAPTNLRHKIFEEVQKPTAEAELIRLGIIYQKKLKNRKFVVLAASIIMVLALGMTSTGSVQNIFQNISYEILNREHEIVDSSDVNTYGAPNEDFVYAEIEKLYGFSPVKPSYRPKDIEFRGAFLGEEIQEIQMVFGFDDQVAILYNIRPNFRYSSFGIDVEDAVVSEFHIKLDPTIIHVKKYEVGTSTYRWSAQFEYQDVFYSILFIGLAEKEVYNVLENLYFI